ncbi:MAG: hybrid sensor histidine kinase/response regulator [Gammaproteobacteria bacterium]|nr:MAG: hybrid sensor histidine kinase/response regulator [Gammaproteobacteria bacterium]
MKSWRVKNRIILLAFFPAIGISLLLGAYFTYITITDLRHHVKQKALALAGITAELLETTQSEKSDKTRLEPVLHAWLQDPDVRSVSILSENGSIMLHAGPQSHFKFSERYLRHSARYDNDSQQTSTFVAAINASISATTKTKKPDTINSGTPNKNPSNPAWIVIEINSGRIQVANYKHILTSTLLVLAGLVLSFLFAFKVGRDLVTPIKQIIQTLSDLKEGKLEARVSIESGHEMRALAAGVNSMAESLSKAYDEMQQNVAQATEDLRKTLETIEVQNIELNVARKEALEASRVKSEFLANMSHEIRTPLNGILGFTNLLLKSYLLPSQRDHLLTIKKSSEILLTIINDILDFSKIEAGKLQLDRIPLKLKETIEEVLTMLAPSAHQKELELVAIVYDDVPNNVFGDPLRIKQIVTNLVNNAIKFTQRGDIVVRAMIEHVKHGKADIKITVTDTGVGLSRIQQESLFNAFSQADASTARQYGGTGLGLIISRRLVEEMGGEIGVKSELGKGATFWIRLSFDIVENVIKESQLCALSEERIIYYESHDTSRLAVSHMLETWQLGVTHVDSLEKMPDRVAQAQAQHQGYAVAIIGIGKFELGSARLKSVVKELEFDRDCRTLIITPTVNEANHPVLETASAHLVKPAPHQRLYDTVATLILGKSIEFTEATYPANKTPDLVPGKKPLVLAVDDNDANLKLVQALLDELNVHVHTAMSGFEALSKAKKNRYDLVFMDVQMPGMDGIETTRKIRELDSQKERNTPIVALTAHALTEEKQKLLASGFDDYLTKPISEAQLQDVILSKTGYQAISYRHSGLYTSPAREIKPSTKSTLGSCVDIEASIKLSAGKPDLAEELFNMLLEHLIEDHEAIQQHFDNDDRDQLMHRVHKLHGATKYCGVPELRHYAEIFETVLKQKNEPLQPHYKNLMSAINRVRNWSDNNNWQEMFRNF